VRWAAVMRGAKKPLSVDFTSNMDDGSGLLPSAFTPTPMVWENTAELNNRAAERIKERFMYFEFLSVCISLFILQLNLVKMVGDNAHHKQLFILCTKQSLLQ
jgi:hypothetical protein